MLNWLFSTNMGGYDGYAGGSWNNYWNNPQPVNTPKADYSQARLHSLELACAAL